MEEELSQIQAIGELIKPYYQELFDSVVIEKAEENDYLVGVDIWDEYGDQVVISVTREEDGSYMISEIGDLVSQFVIDLNAVFDKERAARVLAALASHWGLSVDEKSALHRFYVSVPSTDAFEAGFAKVYGFLEELAGAATLAKALRLVK